ncbi:MAG TPA: hypothetical protein VFH93_04585 [Thermoleophilia bacterium]|nr:hypothetical protein [Thermoleophilia bacterium]
MAKPAGTLKGKRVKIKVQRKVGTRWVTAKSVSVAVSSTGAYSWKYKPRKRGSYRVRTSIASASTYTASKSPLKKFRVK